MECTMLATSSGSMYKIDVGTGVVTRHVFNRDKCQQDSRALRSRAQPSGLLTGLSRVFTRGKGRRKITLLYHALCFSADDW